MSSLPLDPQSPKGRHPNPSSSLRSLSPSVEKRAAETYTKLTSHSTLDEAVDAAGPQGLENESVVTISSGTYLEAATPTESPSFTISLTDSNHVNSDGHRNADCADGQFQGIPSMPSVSFTPSSTRGSTPQSNGLQSSESAVPRGENSVPQLNCGLTPETPLVKTSDLSDASADSDTTASSQSGDKCRKGDQSRCGTLEI